jgi:hypothetical protein
MNRIRQLDVLCGLVTGVITVASAVAAARTVHHVDGRVAHERRAAEQSARELNTCQRQLQEVSAARDMARRQLALLRKRMIEKGDTGAFLEQVDRLVAHHGVDLVDLQPLRNSRAGDLETGFTIHCRGHLGNLYDLLYALENDGPLVKPAQMRLIGSPESGTCDLTVAMGVFER